MMGKPGWAVVSYHDKQLPFHEEVISAHALVASITGGFRITASPR